MMTRRDVMQASAATMAAAGSGLVLTGCGGSDTAAGDSMTFLAVVPMTSLTYAPEMLSDAAGYFTEAGLAVDFQSTRGSAQAIQLVLAGGAPLVRIGQIEAMKHMVDRGAPMLNVSTNVKESAVRIVSSAANPLTEPRDFEGRLLGIPSEGGESETTMDLLLASGGVDLDSVERQVVGVGPGVFNLVEQGRIAGFIVSIDTARILARQMEGVVVLSPGDFITSGSQFYMIARERRAQNEDMIRRYLRTIRRAKDFIMNDDGFDETLRIIRQKYSFGTLADEVVAKQALEDYVHAWTAEGPEWIMRTNPESWQAGYDEMVAAGQIEGGHNPVEWFTNDLVDSL